MNEVNELFTKENVEQIVVPQVVKDVLLQNCIQGQGS